jgi:hypothetical protein
MTATPSRFTTISIDAFDSTLGKWGWRRQESKQTAKDFFKAALKNEIGFF